MESWKSRRVTIANFSVDKPGNLGLMVICNFNLDICFCGGNDNHCAKGNKPHQLFHSGERKHVKTVQPLMGSSHFLPYCECAPCESVVRTLATVRTGSLYIRPVALLHVFGNNLSCSLKLLWNFLLFFNLAPRPQLGLINKFVYDGYLMPAGNGVLSMEWVPSPPHWAPLPS